MTCGLDSGRRAVAVLEADPDLGSGVDERELAEATRRSLARVVELDSRTWDPSAIAKAAEPGWLGVYVLEGLMVRRVTVGSRAACELFGPGDVLRPWDTDGEYDPLPIIVDWLVLSPARLALLDTGFAVRMARWPSVTSKVCSRLAQRARYLALIQAVTHLPRTHSRLLLLFWLLAERWGRVGPDGIVITLPLTHELLALLVGSHRPTVTLALQRLDRANLLKRERRNRWLLTRQAVDLLAHPESLALIESDEADADEEDRGDEGATATRDLAEP